MSDVSLENHFEKKGIVVAQPPAGMSDIEEVSVDHAIEVGAEEVSPLDDNQTLTVSLIQFKVILKLLQINVMNTCRFSFNCIT